MNNIRILVVDQDESSMNKLTVQLSELGCEWNVASNARQAIDLFLDESFELVIADANLSDPRTTDLVAFIRKTRPSCPVIVADSSSTVDAAVSCLKAGAVDYLARPVKTPELKKAVERAFATAESPMPETENPLAKEPFEFGKMIGMSNPIKRVFEAIEKVSSSDSTVIIYGESGTGKELVARAIHYNSPRRDKPLIPVNCGAIPTDLLESELFGHEKGAFTGAIRSRAGRFELAQSGTIFLDEIGDMSPALQVKVLRAIQERQFERIGGIKTIHADVRIITATNQNLEEAVADKRFREDLFYRINVIPIFLPPLRERGSDIILIANHFLRKFNLLKGKNVSGFSPEAIRNLMRYAWPGNVRELENLMEMLIVMKEEGEIVPEDLPPRIRSNRVSGTHGALDGMEIPEEGIDFNAVVGEFEKHLLIKALKISKGVKNRAAKLLNLNRTTLVEKLKRAGLMDTESGP